MRKLRVLQVESFYSPYLERVYRENEFLSGLSFEHQTRFLLSDGFSSSHNLAPFFDPNVFDCLFVVKNCSQTQAAWGKEHGFSSEGPHQVIAHQVATFQPDIVYLSDIYGFPFSCYEGLSFRPFTAAWLASVVREDFPWGEIDLLLSGIRAVREAAMALGAGAAEHFMPAAPFHMASAPSKLALIHNRAVFAGSLTAGIHDKRLEHLVSLARANPEVGFDLFTSADPNAFQLPSNCRLYSPVYASELVAIYASYPLVIDLRGDFALGDSQEIETANMRIFEALAAGCCVYTNRCDAILSLFERHPGVLTYQTEQQFIKGFAEAFSYSQAYRSHSDQRAQAEAQTATQHTVNARATELQQIVLRHFSATRDPKAELEKSQKEPTSKPVLLVCRVSESYLLSIEYILKQVRHYSNTYHLLVICADRESYKRLSSHCDHFLSLVYEPQAVLPFLSSALNRVLEDVSTYVGLAEPYEQAIFLNCGLGLFDINGFSVSDKNQFCVIPVAGPYAGIERLFPEIFSYFCLADRASIKTEDVTNLFHDYLDRVIASGESQASGLLNYVPILKVSTSWAIGYHAPCLESLANEKASDLLPPLALLSEFSSSMANRPYTTEQVLGFCGAEVLQASEALAFRNESGFELLDAQQFLVERDNHGGWSVDGVSEVQHRSYLAVLRKFLDGAEARADLLALKTSLESLGFTGRLLEVGCGSGYLSQLIEPLGFSYEGIDISPHMVASAQSYYPGKSFEVMNSEELGFESESFDVVVNAASLMHTKKYEAAISEGLRVSGGCLILHTLTLSERATHIFFEKSAYGTLLKEVVYSESQLAQLFSRMSAIPLRVEIGMPYNLTQAIGISTTSVTATLHSEPRYLSMYRNEGVYFCTLFDMNYLAKGLCLIESLFQHRPNSKIVVLCLDDLTYDVLGSINMQGEIVRVPLNELVESDKEFGEAKSNRSLIEWYFTATSVLAHFVATTYKDCKFVIYLDADLYFSGPCDHFIKSADLFDTQIIGHNFSPKYQGAMKYGIYNVGWVLFNLQKDGLKVISDYRKDCLEWCHDYLDGDRFGDQKYLEKWPSRYRVQEVFNNAYNLAVWNYEKSSLKKHFGNIYVDGLMLCFAHIQGVRCLDGERFQVTYTEGTLKGQMIEIYASYLDKLNSHHRRLSELTGYGSKIIRFTKVT